MRPLSRSENIFPHILRFILIFFLSPLSLPSSPNLLLSCKALTIGFNSTDYTINEGGSVVFTVIKQGANAIPVFVTFSTSDGTALGGYRTCSHYSTDLLLGMVWSRLY